MKIKHFFDKATFTLTYVVYDEISKDAVIIDPVLDYDPASSQLARKSLQKHLAFIEENALSIGMILETHVHADHVTSAQEIKKSFPDALVAICENIRSVQETFQSIFNLHMATDGSQFDLLLRDDQVVHVGSLCFKVISTPGHTPACASFLFAEAVFTGDALFMPDYGTGRCDFPRGSAEDLYHSVHDKLYSLPPETNVYVGHDYMPNGREMAFKSTIEEEKATNIHIKSSTKKAAFAKMRQNRDKTLSAPRLLLPSIQINMEAGRLPKAEDNGVRYLKIPLREE